VSSNRSARGETGVVTLGTFTWTSTSRAEAYELAIGTAKGSHNLLNSGPLSSSTTSDTVLGLPWGEPLWARVSTEVGGIWNHQDITFTPAPRGGSLTNPTNGETEPCSNALLSDH
jgi:hypothetical protein